jgi:predicted N-acyltransferase
MPTRRRRNKKKKEQESVVLEGLKLQGVMGSSKANAAVSFLNRACCC